MNTPKFTPDQIIYIIDNYKAKTPAEMEGDINIKASSIIRKLYKMGFKKDYYKIIFTDEQSDYIKTNYKTKSDEEIANHLSIPRSHIVRFRSRHQLRKIAHKMGECMQTDKFVIARRNEQEKLSTINRKFNAAIDKEISHNIKFYEGFHKKSIAEHVAIIVEKFA